ncbi:hypothetical protein [Viridibacillus sp. FSL H8-0110]|uniref:hypothetical protein n=1 Tax=Viridibacillus sp. FSL H8-0110 TaxID=2921376 RepID=UPI0030F82683
MSEKTIVINIPSVDTWNLTQLRFTCKNKKVKGYTKMSREQLIEEVKRIFADLAKEKANVHKEGVDLDA